MSPSKWTVITAFAAWLAVVTVAQGGQTIAPSQGRMEWLTRSVGVFHDNVNVGVIRRDGKTLLIESGDGGIVEAAKALGLGPIDWVLYTDHHRDQCSSAPHLKQAGAKIAVSAAEADFYRNATKKWAEADKVLYHRYYFRPDFFYLRSSVEPDRELQPGETFRWQGLDIQVVGTPGPTDGAVSYLIEMEGKKLAFTGDLIYSPGKLWNFYMLQKGFPGMPGDYWGFGGTAGELVKSLDSIVVLKPDALVPAHGVVMTDPAAAVAQLKANLHAVLVNYMTTAAWRIYFNGNYRSPIKSSPGPEYEVPMLPVRPLPQSPAWLHKLVNTSWYLQADDGSIFLIDCGFDPVLANLKTLAKNGTIKGVEAMWISHYHDDHTQSINAVRREFGTRVYVQKELQDILENPTAYSMPCMNPENMHIDRALSEGEEMNWKGFKLTFFYFPGQTLYHDGLLIEHDGTSIFETGDSFANFGIDDYCSYNRNFLGSEPGYERCYELLLRLQPTMLLASHWGLLPFSKENLQQGLELLRQRRQLMSALLPGDDPNFGLDPSWVRAYPYRQAVLPGQTVTLEARIYNHSGSAQQASVELRAPVGWRIQQAAAVTIPAHTEGKIRFTAQAPSAPTQNREVLGLAVHFEGHNWGEVAEALVDYLR